MPHKPIRAALIAVALAVGIAGCGHGGTTVAEPGQTAAVSPVSTEHSGPMVDVAAVWETTPLPPCPRVIVDNNLPDAPGAELPTKDTVAAALSGVKSPASEEWVRDELGWVTQWLIQTRTSINNAANPVAVGESSTRLFNRYVEHVRQELEEGRDIPDATLDNVYPEGCR